MTTQTVAPRWKPKAVQEALIVWGLSFAAIVVTFVLLRGYAKLVATAGFLYLPMLFMRDRDEDHSTYGVTLRHWRADLKLFAQCTAVIVPTFFLIYVAYVKLLPLLPRSWLASSLPT